MKITQEHYKHMLDAMKWHVLSIPNRRKAIATDPRVKDAAKRLRWDLLYDSVTSRWICDNLYSYVDDTHIDTALRSIMRDLEADQ